MNIVYCGDSKVVKPVAVSIKSIERTGISLENINIYIVTKNWSDTDKNYVLKLIKNIKINFIDFKLNLPTVRKGRHVTESAYILLYIPEILSNIDKVLYLDLDVIIRDDRILNLWNTDLNEKPLGGVNAIANPYIGSPSGIKKWREYNLNPKAPMLNTGVILLDLTKIRKEKWFEKAKEFAYKEGSVSGLADQHAINVALNGNWKELSPIYNAIEKAIHDNSGAYSIFGKEEADLAKNNPCILHFAGKRKPWLTIPEEPFFDEWRNIASEIDWEPWKEKSNISDFIKSYKRKSILFIKNIYKGIAK